MVEKFHLLSYGLACVLIFIGAKMLLLDVFKIPITVSLGVVAVLIALSMWLSLVVAPRPAATPAPAPPESA
jgi:tellurite resistance protein TerC